MKNQENKPILIWLLLGFLLIFLMVVIGGITRLTNSGLSMVDWKLIVGSIPPLNEQQWLETFEKYKQFPEYQQQNFRFTLDEFKSIFFWEYLHRLLGRLIGLVFVIPFVYFLIKKKLSKKLIKQCLVMLGLGALQGGIGWWMVKSGLVKDPDVSHYRLAIHLITAFLTAAYIFWVGLGLIYEEALTQNFNKLKRLLFLLLGLVVLQIIYGAFVSGLNAGFILNTWPKMGESWIDASVTAMSPFVVNFIEGIGGVQFIHRYLAYIVSGLVFYVWWRGSKYELSSLQKKGLLGMIFIVVFQFFLGVLTLIYSVPIWLGVLHQVGAFFLLGMVVFNLSIFSRKA